VVGYCGEDTQPIVPPNAGQHGTTNGISKSYLDVIPRVVVLAEMLRHPNRAGSASPAQVAPLVEPGGTC